MYYNNYCNFRFLENGFFQIVQMYRQIRFRDTIQTKEYSFDELVGNVGGYMGLFTGYALIHVPEFINSIYYSIKKFINDNKTFK